MPTFESAGNSTPFSEANEEKDIKNLGIKTTISITHNHIQQEITEKMQADGSPYKTS